MLPVLALTAGLFLPPNNPPDCPQGQVMTFNGTVYSCTAALSAPCLPGTTLRKRGDGSVACEDDAREKTVAACPEGQAAVSVGERGTVACAPPAPELSCHAAEGACAEGEFPRADGACCRFGGEGK